VEGDFAEGDAVLPEPADGLCGVVGGAGEAGGSSGDVAGLGFWAVGVGDVEGAHEVAPVVGVVWLGALSRKRRTLGRMANRLVAGRKHHARRWKLLACHPA
jgi:hypothetical protein